MISIGLTSAIENRVEFQENVLEEYLGKIAGGDKDALADLYQETKVAVYGFSLSIVKNFQDAEDVLQNVYIQVFLSADRYIPNGKAMAWIFTIARNLALMEVRKRGKAVCVSDEDMANISVQSADESIEDKIVLKHAMTILSDQERQIMMLHAVGGLKHREIADILHCPVSTVLSKYRRSITKLQDKLKEKMI